MPLAKRGAAPVVDKPAETGVVTTSTTPPVTAPRKLGTPAKKDSESMSKAEWAAKDKRISRAGVWQAALQSTGLLQLNTQNTFEAYMALVDKAAEHGLQFINKDA